MPISPNKEAMLRALAKYKYLTVLHVLKLGISKSADKTSQYFRQLKKDYGFVDRQIHYGIPKGAKSSDPLIRTRHEYLRHLTAQGAKFLDSRTELSFPNIRFPKRPKQYISNDYHHRVSTISMHLSFDRRMVQQAAPHHQFMTYYQQYQQTKLKRFEAETRLQFKDKTHYTPDAFCAYTTPDRQDHLFALEVYNSRGHHRIKYVVEQLEKLLRIIDHTKKIEKRTGLNAIPRILCTLDSKAFLVGVFKRVRSNSFFQMEHIEQLLFFNVDVNVWNQFGDG